MSCALDDHWVSADTVPVADLVPHYLKNLPDHTACSIIKAASLTPLYLRETRAAQRALGALDRAVVRLYTHDNGGYTPMQLAAREDGAAAAERILQSGEFPFWQLYQYREFWDARVVASLDALFTDAQLAREVRDAAHPSEYAWDGPEGDVCRSLSDAFLAYTVAWTNARLSDLVNAMPPLDKECVVFRGVRTDLFAGGPYVARGFTSVSNSPRAAEQFHSPTGNNFLYRMVLPAGTRAMAMADSSLTRFAESEIILPHGVRFTKVDARDYAGYVQVDVEVNTALARPLTVAPFLAALVGSAAPSIPVNTQPSSPRSPAPWAHSPFSATSPSYSPSSPAHSPFSATSPSYSPSSPAHSPFSATSPSYSPSSPAHTPFSGVHATSPSYSPSSPAHTPFSGVHATSPSYSPSSPAHTPFPSYSPSSPARSPAWAPFSPVAGLGGGGAASSDSAPTLPVGVSEGYRRGLFADMPVVMSPLESDVVALWTLPYTQRLLQRATPSPSLADQPEVLRLFDHEVFLAAATAAGLPNVDDVAMEGMRGYTAAQKAAAAAFIHRDARRRFADLLARLPPLKDDLRMYTDQRPTLESLQGAILTEKPDAYQVEVQAGTRVLPIVDSAGQLSVVVSPEEEIAAYTTSGVPMGFVGIL
jgi:hypothetical protein